MLAWWRRQWRPGRKSDKLSQESAEEEHTGQKEANQRRPEAREGNRRRDQAEKQSWSDKASPGTRPRKRNSGGNKSGEQSKRRATQRHIGRRTQSKHQLECFICGVTVPYVHFRFCCRLGCAYPHSELATSTQASTEPEKRAIEET